jgi:glycosyltransferase involved in cell wall biosynthesis
MIIISSAKMGHGTFQAKFIPLSKVETVEKIYVVRKDVGPKISKVEYLVLPKMCRFFLFNLLLTPMILAYYTIKLKADLILAYHFVPHAFFAWFVSLISKKTFIFGQTGGESQEIASNSILKYFAKIVLKKAKVINVPGNQAKHFWTSWGLPETKINVLHSTIDTNLFVPTKDKRDIDVLYVGILNSRKQVDKIIKSFKNMTKKYPEAKLGIVGAGPDHELLQNLVSDLKLKNNVEFFGFQKDVKQFLNRSKLFVMFSTTEGLPVALMEAMSCQKLVIAPAVDNIPTVLIDGKTGLLLPKNDFSALKNKMMYAYENYDKLQNMRENARKKIVDEYSYENAIKKWQKIFRNIEAK